MPNTLTLTTHPPFRPSHLSIPPSPFSPLSPLTPLPKPETQRCTTHTGTVSSSITDTKTPATFIPSPPAPTPVPPLQWLWTCHKCSSTYPLGATRQCLDDGHSFCAGTTIVKHWCGVSAKKKTKRHKACASEFDYIGWKSWGRWKRSTSTNNKAERLSVQVEEEKKMKKKTEKDCWQNCDYPSQCRWGKKVGVWTPTPTKTTFDVPSLSTIDLSMSNTPMKEMPTLDDCFAPSPPSSLPDNDDVSADALGRALEASTKRWKSLEATDPTSPLTESFSAQTVEHFDVEMLDVDNAAIAKDRGCIDPSLLALGDTSYILLPTAQDEASAISVSISSSSTLDKIKSLLSTYKGTSRRQLESPLALNQPRKNTLRRSTLTLQKPFIRLQDQRIDDEVLSDGLSPLEGVKRWTEVAVNVV